MTDQNATALRFLALNGQTPALVIAGAAGWTPRSAGAKLRRLERQGLVKRALVKHGTARSDPKYEWVITDKGRSVAA